MDSPIPMLDLMFFLTETRDNPRHVGAVLLFQRPRRGGEAIVRQIVAAYRRATPIPPFNRVPVFARIGRPVWREQSDIDMTLHVQELTLPTPGSDEQLDRLVAELHAPMLDRLRPGWRIYVIDGLARNRFAIYVKVHHALLDGESGIALVHRSLAASPRDKRIRPVVTTRLPSRESPSSQDLLQRLERDAVGLARRGSSIVSGSLRLIEESVSGLRGYSSEQDRPFTAPRTPMNEPIRNARAVARTVLPLRAMKAVARATDTTLNDVALCVLDAGMNRYLRRLGRPAGHPIVAVCPVSLHDPRFKRTSTELSIFWTRLGTPEAAIATRMRQVIDNTREAKQRVRTLRREAAYAYAVLTFAMAETLGLVRPATWDFFLPSNVLISNVRGPTEPLYLNGARLEALVPLSTLIGGMGLNITFMSYAGKVVIGYTANAAALPEIGLLARFTADSFAALERQTRRGTVRKRRPRG